VSENKRQFETAVGINDKSQGTAVKHLRYCGIFNDNLLQIHCWVCSWQNFKTSRHLAKLQARKSIVSRCVHLDTVLLKDEALARYLKYGKKQLLLTGFTWLRHYYQTGVDRFWLAK